MTAPHLMSAAARPRPLRLGYVPLTDCAPLVLAQELGLFRRYRVNVALHRELGWATVRDKIIYGELDAAHAVAGMPFAATLGLGCARCECVTGLVLSLHGNAITVSNDLARVLGVPGGLRSFIAEARAQRTLNFGTVSQFSSHHYLLRQWLKAAGVDPDHDVRMVVVPPPQMVMNLKAGHLDGFCAGEPWNSVAVETRAGLVAATSAELDPGHPEKVLMVRKDFAERRTGEHEALIAALLEACEFCAAPENRETLVRTLTNRVYVGVSETALRAGLKGDMCFAGDFARPVPGFFVFHGEHTNEPSADKAAWVAQHLRSSGVLKRPGDITPALLRASYRCDIYDRASHLRAEVSKSSTPEPTNTQLALA